MMRLASVAAGRHYATANSASGREAAAYQPRIGGAERRAEEKPGAVPGPCCRSIQPRSEAMKRVQPRVRAEPAARRRRRRRVVRPERAARARVEPPRGAGDHDDAQGRRHRLLHVQQLRAEPPDRPGLRHPGRQLPAAAGRVRRPELLQARPERALRDPHRQQRRRQGRHHLPVPLQQLAEGQDAGDRPRRQHQGRGDSADPVRPGDRAQRRQPQRQRDLHGRHRPRRSPHRHARLDHQHRGRQQRLRQAVDNIGTKTIPNYAAYAAQHIYTVNIPGCDHRARSSSASARTRSRSTSA